MDRSATSHSEYSAAVRVTRAAPLDLLLPAAARERGEPALAAAAGRTLPAVAVLRQSPHGRYLGRQPQAHPTADAYLGHRSSVSETQFEPSGAEPRSLSYLLRGVAIERPNQVWSTDITYIPMKAGFLYLVAVMDWFSRFVLSWELSNTMETGFCLTALEAAFRFGQPEIWNSDQGAQFTAADFLAPLKNRGISISMDGRGRALDNVFIERLWRSLKYELIYPADFVSGSELMTALGQYFPFTTTVHTTPPRYVLENSRLL
jgi:putative transposase